MKKEAFDSAIALIRTMDVHEAAKEMAAGLKLNAEVRTCVGKWDERGSIAGWTKVGKTPGRVTTLVEVFVSDISGEDREFDRYARTMKELLAENESLRVQIAALRPTAPGEVEKLRELSEKATAGPWAYRPEEFDDWGLIRGGKPDADGRRWPVAVAREGRFHTDEELSEHRRNKTDPSGPNAAFIVAAVNYVRTLLSPAHPERAKEEGE